MWLVACVRGVLSHSAGARRVGESGASPAWLLSLRLGADPPSVQDEDQTKIMSSEACPLWDPSKSVRSAQGRLDLPDPDLYSLRPKVVPPSGLSLSPSCTAMNRPRTYMFDGNWSRALER